MDSRISDQDAITEKKAKEQAEALEKVKGLLAESGIQSKIVLTIKLDVNPRTCRFISHQPAELAVFYAGRQAAIVTVDGGRSVSYVVRSPRLEGGKPVIRIDGLDSPETVAALIFEVFQGVTS
ncbi:hypothetical protein [Streptosporangium sp. NPDC087985]|uniref:hypothetical protein n=1 Tax=Streptosporangium sp. NPDC087985 TaxID=3366196 RepID=UPI00382DC6A6